MAKAKFDWLIVKPILPTEQQTPAGIILPKDLGESRLKAGVVISAGPGKWENGMLTPMDIKEGDEVYFDSMNIMPLNVNGEVCFMMRQENCFATI